MTLTIEFSLLAHLDAQIASARKLLQLVLEQGAAVRGRDAEAVLIRMSEIQAEMGRRATLEINRTSLLQEAGRALRRRVLPHPVRELGPGPDRLCEADRDGVRPFGLPAVDRGGEIGEPAGHAASRRDGGAGGHGLWRAGC